MGFFSRKQKKKKTESNAVKTASGEVACTPGTKEAPTTHETPETVKEVESPGIPAAPSPAVASADGVTSKNESKPADIEESGVQEEEKPAGARAKKKHRTRISVTTANETEEDTDGLNLTDEHPEADNRASMGDLAELKVPGEDGRIDIDRSVENAGDESAVDSTYIGDEQNSETSQDDERNPEENAVNKNLLSTFEGCDILPDSLKAMLPESWQQTDNATEEKDATLVVEPVKKKSYYSEDFATNFLEELLKKGFALVYHQPSLTIEEEKADWQGRSVTMNFKAGICNALEVFQPEIEWSTLGGGKDKKILTRSVSLLDIHSIAVSNIDDMRDSLEAGESEEIQCFFTMTTKSGDIHVFEAMNIEESNRLVLGIKNISGRYSNLIVAGDPRVMVEFFDNSSDPQEIRLPFQRAIVQVSHAFLG